MIYSPVLPLALFLSTAFAWHPSERDCSGEPLCLKSFKWCDDRNEKGCYLPEGAYPPNPTAEPRRTWPVLLLDDRNYTVSWEVDERNKDTPVQVVWSFGGTKWDVNTTESQITFSPQEIIKKFNSTTQAGYDSMTSKNNVISITQPITINKSNYPQHSGAPYDISDHFMIASHWMKRYLDAREERGHQEEHKKWKLGVGIGVGLGVPFLMALSSLCTWLVLKKRGAKTHEVDPKTLN